MLALLQLFWGNVWKFILFFFGSNFQPHRFVGFAYLAMYGYAIYLYIFDYETGFLNSFVLYAMPLCGVLQSMVAARTFTFLPKKKEPGYVAFGDIGAMSYNYVVENSFFAGLLAFQWM